MDFPSAFWTNFLHVDVFALVISLVYLLALSRQAFFSCSRRVLRYLFLSLHACLRKIVRFLFHHRLLCGHSLFIGVVSAIAFCIVFTNLIVHLSIPDVLWRSSSDGDLDRLDSRIVLNLSQSVLAKSSFGAVSALSFAIDSHVSIGRWSEPWSFSLAIRHLTIFASIAWLPHTRSIAVLAFGYVTVPGGIRRARPRSAASSTS